VVSHRSPIAEIDSHLLSCPEDMTERERSGETTRFGNGSGIRESDLARIDEQQVHSAGNASQIWRSFHAHYDTRHYLDTKGNILDPLRQVAEFFGKPAEDTILFENQGKHCFEIRLMLDKIGKGSRILDIGGGMGVNLLCLHRMMGTALQLFLVDRFQEYADDNPMGPWTTGLQLMQQAAISVTNQDFWDDYSLRYDSDQFDLVTCFDVIEHFPGHPLRLLGEVKRILRPEGAFILGGPNAIALNRRIKLLVGMHPYIAFQGWCSAKYIGHFREYSAKEYQQLLEMAGLECVETYLVPEPMATRARYSYHKRKHSWISPKSVALRAAYLLELLVPGFRQSAYFVASKTL